MTNEVKKRYWTERIAFYLLGVVVMAFGIAMAIRADIGVAPGSTIPCAVSKLTPLTIGQCSSLFNVFFILVQLAITRRPTIKLVFQFPMAYANGFLLDAFYGLLDIPLTGMLYRVLLLLAGLVVFSLGIRIIVGADVLLSPADGLAQAIGNLFRWPMSKSKLVFDIVVTAFTMILTLILAGDAFLVVNVGTVICAIGTGPIIGVFTKLFPFFDVRDDKK